MPRASASGVETEASARNERSSNGEAEVDVSMTCALEASGDAAVAASVLASHAADNGGLHGWRVSGRSMLEQEGVRSEQG